MKFNEERGNLFDLDRSKYAFGHCISLDCQMDEGIAKKFKKEFKGLQTFCKFTVNFSNLSHPCVATYMNKNDEIVFNLITKNKYWNKPTYESIEICIEDMAEKCRQGNIKYLALPKIGCGLDRLQWGKVREIIKDKFKDLDIEIEVRWRRR